MNHSSARVTRCPRSIRYFASACLRFVFEALAEDGLVHEAFGIKHDFLCSSSGELIVAWPLIANERQKPHDSTERQTRRHIHHNRLGHCAFWLGYALGAVVRLTLRWVAFSRHEHVNQDDHDSMEWKPAALGNPSTQFNRRPCRPNSLSCGIVTGVSGMVCSARIVPLTCRLRSDAHYLVYFRSAR